MAAPSRTVAIAAFAAVHGVLVAGAVAAFHGLAGHGSWNWGDFWTRAVGSGLAVWVLVALQRPLERFFGPGPAQARREEERTVTRAVRAGAFPADADPARWRPQPVRWLRQAQAFLAVYAVATLLVAALVLLTALRVEHGDPGVLAVAAVLAAAVPLLVGAGLRPVRRARRLRDELPG